ncbi:MAG: efflux RND transporter periplasmic adaptor subunit [Deltaproteobacteria bacterium]|nr:efflux RND transporter periplasmic adaptor subunit [Deltaproteobacteria bacterium]
MGEMTTTPSLDDLRIDRDEANGGGRRRWPIVVVLLLFLVGGSLVLWRWLAPGTASVGVAQARQVATGTAAGAVLDASGYVTARRRATVSSKITARVVEVFVEEGMRIENGQVLARLDDSSEVRRLALSEAELGAARKAVVETGVLLAESDLQLGRVRSLASAGVSTSSDLDAAVARVDSLQARKEFEEQQVEVARRRLALSRQNLEDTVVRAPFSGVAISKDAQPGEMISPVSAGGGFTRTGICTLVDMTSLEIEVDVNEAYINRVEPGQSVQATLDAYPDWKIPAAVITTVPAADRQKATMTVRIGFEELDPRILPDMGVKVSFLDEEIRQQAASRPASRPVVLAPQAAVRRDGNQDILLVVAGDLVERRAIQIGGRQGKDVEILAGLSAGERVVVEGPESLSDGDRVKVVEP